MAKQEAISFMEFKISLIVRTLAGSTFLRCAGLMALSALNAVTRPITLFQQETAMSAPLATIKHPSQ